MMCSSRVGSKFVPTDGEEEDDGEREVSPGEGEICREDLAQ